MLGFSFLVIEPAKQEYKQLKYIQDIDPPCQVFTLGDEADQPLRLNPFQFVQGFPLLTHIDYLKAIFNASFPMYGPMPYILEEALLLVYENLGWDITSGTNKYADGEEAMCFLPTLQDLYESIDLVVEEKRYAENLQWTYRLRLKARIKSSWWAEKVRC